MNWKSLIHGVRMNLPGIFSFDVVYWANGKRIQPTSEKDIKEIELYDPQCAMRLKCAEEIDEYFIWRINLFFALGYVYSNVSQSSINRPPVNSLLLNITEQAMKQYINDLDALMKDFIKLLDTYKGKHANLFRKGAQKKLIEILIKGNSAKEKEYRKKSDIIDTKRAGLFSHFNAQGVPKHESFDALKERIFKLRDVVNPYRDKVSSHPEKDVVLEWNSVNDCIIKLKNIVFDFYEVVSFRYPPTTKVTGIDPQITAEYLINGIFPIKNLTFLS